MIFLLKTKILKKYKKKYLCRFCKMKIPLCLMKAHLKNKHKLKHL